MLRNILQERRKRVALALIGLFLVAFLIRVYQPQSRPAQWLLRARAFWEAVEHQEWADTYQQYHPGVTTMIIAGVGVRLGERYPHVAEALLSWLTPDYMSGTGWRMFWGSIPLSFVISLLIVGTTWVLLELSDWKIAFSAGAFMALSPFYLSQSRVVHVDGLLSAFMIFSAVLAMLYIDKRRSRIIAFSGAAGGLAVLTKSPGLFAMMFAGLVLLVGLALRVRQDWAEHQADRWRWLLRLTLSQAVVPMLIWLVCAAAMFVIWPAMWVDPGGTIGQVAKSIVIHTSRPHPKPRFFMGTMVSPETRPSILFYPVTMAFQLTFVSFVLSIVSVGFYTLWRRRVKLSFPARHYWLIMAYLFFYLLQMLMSAKQDQRYIVPADLPFQILAAIGLVGVMNVAHGAFAKRSAQLAERVEVGIFGVAMALQFVTALIFIPDFGAHRNYLLGGNRIAVKVVEVSGDQNEGAQDIAAYIARYGDPDAVIAASAKAQLTLLQHLPVENIITWPDTEDGQRADFLVFDYLTRQRFMMGGYWQDVFDEYEDDEPAALVLFDGVEYFRLVDTHPDSTLPHVVIRRGWNGFIVIAWLSTLSLIALLIWGLPRLKRTPESPSP